MQKSFRGNSLPPPTPNNISLRVLRKVYAGQIYIVCGAHLEPCLRISLGDHIQGINVKKMLTFAQLAFSSLSMAY